MGDIYTNPPQSRNEAILRATIDGTEYTAPPQSRIEDLLIELKAAIEQSGGGTTVVANPEGEATDEVKKLQVGSTVYAVEDEAGRQLVEDTVGWESINLADIPEADQTFTLVKSSARIRNIALKNSVPSGNYNINVKLTNVANLTKAVRVQLLNSGGTTIFTDAVNLTQDGTFNIACAVTSAIAKIYFYIANDDAETATATISKIMITKPIYAGFPYQPYHASVDATKTDNSVIAPVENGTTVQKSGGYAVGSHAIRNGAFITWKNAKAQGETINDASDYASGDVADELETSLTEVTTNNVHVTLDSTYKHIIKFGKVCVIRVTFTLDADTSSSSNVLFATTLKAFGKIQMLNIRDAASPYTMITSCSPYINTDGSIIIRSLQAGSYIIDGTYICQ